MKFLAKVLILGVSLAVFPSCNSSGAPAGQQTDPPVNDTPVSHADLYYLNPTSIPVGTWLDAPFAAGTIEEENDLAAIMGLQASRTTADCARAKTEVDITLDSFFGPAYGPLTEAQVTALNPFFEKIENDADYAAGEEKNFWKRPRPYVTDSAIQPCIKLETSYAYPSGHSTISHTFSAVLDVIFPNLKTQIDARADQIAEDRVMGGVHYPSDIEAGKLMATRVFQAIEQNADFQNDLKAARENQ